MELVLPHETVEELGIGAFRVIQDKGGFCFGSDAVLLASFATPRAGQTGLDLCTGTGIIPVLLWAKHRLRHMDALELVPEVADMARRTMELNAIASDVTVRQGDVKDAAALYGRRSFDFITCNPPYMECGAGLVNPNDRLAAARHELFCTLDDIVRVSALLLRQHGRLFMVHRADRLCDVLCTFRRYAIEPKRLSMVQARWDKAPNLVLVEGLLGGGKQLTVTAPVLMYDADGNYLQQIR